MMYGTKRAPRTRMPTTAAWVCMGAGCATLALLTAPLSLSADADGRRLTLGANRPLYDFTPPFLLPYDQSAAGPTLWASPLAAASTPASTTPAAVAVHASTATTRPGPPVQAQTITPAFKAEPAPARLTKVQDKEPRTEGIHAGKQAPATTVHVKAGKSTRVNVHAPHTKVAVRDARVSVKAPSTKVAVRDHRVRVDAPHTRVAVDDGRVRVRAPFVNLDIRW